MELLLFIALAATAIGASVALIAHPNPIYCALFMVVVFVATAILYVLLQAPFMAALQIIVYAGAIVVLFLFVISYLGQRAESSLMERGRLPLGMAALLAVVLAVELVAAVVTGGGRQGALGEPVPVAPGFGSVEGVAERLFTHYLVPFEVTSVLLIVAMVGAVVLSHRAREGDRGGVAGASGTTGESVNGDDEDRAVSAANEAAGARGEAGRP